MATRNLILGVVLSSRNATKAISNNTLSSSDIALLVLIGETFIVGWSYFSLFHQQTIDWAFFAEALGAMGITATGVWYCFKSNGGEGGNRFTEKFLVLSTPIAWKIALLNWPIFSVGSYALTYATVNVSDDSFDAIVLVWEITWNLSITGFFFLRLAHWMRLSWSTPE